MSGRPHPNHPAGCFCATCCEALGTVPPAVGASIITERDQVRGSFSDQAYVSQNLKMNFRAQRGKWPTLPTTHKEALDNIANKIARILTGDPNEIDSWADISGYAELVLREIKK